MTTQDTRYPYPTEWNVTLLYSSFNDPQFEKDMRAYERAYAQFEKKYKGKTDWLKNKKKLLTALGDWRALSETVGSLKPMVYVHLRASVDSSNEEVQARVSALSQRITNTANKIVFFGLALGKIPAPFQKSILADKAFTHYAHLLKHIFNTSKYDLSESEEKILNLMSLPAYDLWVRGVEKALNEKTVIHKGTTMPLSEAMNSIHTLKTEDRYALHDKVMKELVRVADFSTSEINAIYTDKKISDELRGFKTPYAATLLSHEISEKTLKQLLSSVNKYKRVSHNFYAVKAQLLKLDTLRYPDRAASVGNTSEKITFEEAVALASAGFEKFGPWYKETFQTFLRNGQIDVFPRKGKEGGAFCWGGLNRPTFVLLNHIENLDSVLTLAHEMGHAFHTELSKKQDVLYQGYSTAVAEVASTFFENIVFEEVFKTLSKREQVIALHDRINDDIQTIYRQIACFNFELDLHTAIRTKGNVSTAEIADMMNARMREYLGPLFSLTKEDGYFFITWSHIRRFFYVYSYAYGQIISKALYKKYVEQPSFAKKIEEFLSAGGSATPERIFKKIGIDTTKPGFFEEGLKSIAENIRRLEVLAKEEKLI